MVHRLRAHLLLLFAGLVLPLVSGCPCPDCDAIKERLSTSELKNGNPCKVSCGGKSIGLDTCGTKIPDGLVCQPVEPGATPSLPAGWPSEWKITHQICEEVACLPAAPGEPCTVTSCGETVSCPDTRGFVCSEGKWCQPLPSCGAAVAGRPCPDAMNDGCGGTLSCSTADVSGLACKKGGWCYSSPVNCKNRGLGLHKTCQGYDYCPLPPDSGYSAAPPTDGTPRVKEVRHLSDQACISETDNKCSASRCGSGMDPLGCLCRKEAVYDCDADEYSYSGCFRVSTYATDSPTECKILAPPV